MVLEVLKTKEKISQLIRMVRTKKEQNNSVSKSRKLTFKKEKFNNTTPTAFFMLTRNKSRILISFHRFLMHERKNFSQGRSRFYMLILGQEEINCE